MNMKTILTETFSVIKVSLFWALALPVAAVIFPIVAGWQKLSSLISSGSNHLDKILRFAAQGRGTLKNRARHRMDDRGVRRRGVPIAGGD